MGHNYVDHNYLGHTYLGQNWIGRNAIGPITSLYGSRSDVFVGLKDEVSVCCRTGATAISAMTMKP